MPLFILDKNFFNRYKRVCISLFFFIFLLVGVNSYRDYGVSWDEPAQRLIGAVNLVHIAKILHLESVISNNQYLSNLPVKSLGQLQDRDYGVIYEVPAIFMEQVLNLKDEQSIYFARHLLTFFFFFSGVLAVYCLAARRFSDWRIGLLAATFLILSPRIFADAFYNDKDLVFLSVLVIAANTAVAFILKPCWSRAILHSFATAIAIDARIMAVIIPALTLLILLLRILRKEVPFVETVWSILIYVPLTIAVTIVLWPFLWENPLGNFIQVFSNMSHFRHNPYFIFLGEMYRAAELPWFYLPIWIGISTPILYLALFIIGLLGTLLTLARNRYKLWTNTNQLQDLIFLSLVVGPIIAIISLNSVLYNGWRHVYFIYPFFILVAIKGWILIWSYIKSKKPWNLIVVIILCFFMSYTAIWMIRYHPLQNIYFNAFAGNWNSKFEVDYWGVANRAALEKILALNTAKTYTIWPGLPYEWPGGWQLPFTQNIRLFSPEDQKKIIVPESKFYSDYFITSIGANDGWNYDSLINDYRFKFIDSINIDGKPILSIFKKIDKPILPTPKVNELIKFSTRKSGLYYLNGPWQNPEEWGSWSNGYSAKLLFPTPKNNPKHLLLQIRPLVTAKYPTQNIETLVNGVFQEKIAINNIGNLVDIKIPENAYQKDNLVIELKLPNATTPKSLGINDDLRILAIGLESAYFR